MPLKILGLNHTTAPVDIREQVIYAGDAIPRALAEIVTLSGVGEAVMLSTCNRTEIYVEADAEGAAALMEWLKADQNLSAEAQAALFEIGDEAAVRHLFRVACGLDSMIL
ncbi:MAG: glutamyl-tRNA reductase, partial [Gammaproteobacteria bacterium]